MEVVFIAFVFALVAAGLSFGIRRWQPSWSVRRSVITAASPLPGLLAAICIWLFADASMASKEQCGIDACGMAMAASLFGLIAAGAGLTFGVVAAILVQRRIGR